MTVAGHAGHEAILDAARYAPSAHNAQPWRLTPRDDGRSYELWYAFADRLDADPDDRDGLIAVGAFYESLALHGAAAGRSCSFEPGVREQAGGLVLGSVTLADPGEVDEPLSVAVGKRRTNRHPYTADRALPEALERDLRALGCAFVAPADVAPLVSRASVFAWRDRRFIDDLRQWTRFDDGAPDGLTCAALSLSRVDRLALRFALWRGRLPAWLARIYAQRDVRLTRSSSVVAVLSVDERTPLALFDCGRRLLRSWTTIVGAGWAYHPISIVIDQPTAPELTRLAGVKDAVAIFRVGYTQEPAVTSNRRPVSATVVGPGGIEPPTEAL